MSAKTHIIVVLLENEFGALSRVANLFSARGYNIETLNVAPTPDPTLSRMTITSVGSERVLEQIIKQLNKLIDVVDAYACIESGHHSRESVLLRLRDNDAIAELVEQWHLSDHIHVDTVERENGQCVLAVSTDTFSLERMLETLGRNDLLEISRSGALAVNNCSSPAKEID